MGIGADFVGTFEGDLSKEFFKGITLEEGTLLACCALAFKLLAHLWRGFFLEVTIFLRGVFITIYDLFLVNLRRHVLKDAVISSVNFFNLLSHFFLVYKRNGPSILCFHIDFGRKGTLVLDSNLS